MVTATAYWLRCYGASEWLTLVFSQQLRNVLILTGTGKCLIWCWYILSTVRSLAYSWFHVMPPHYDVNGSQQTCHIFSDEMDTIRIIIYHVRLQLGILSFKSSAPVLFDIYVHCSSHGLTKTYRSITILGPNCVNYSALFYRKFVQIQCAVWTWICCSIT